MFTVVGVDSMRTRVKLHVHAESVGEAEQLAYFMKPDLLIAAVFTGAIEPACTRTNARKVYAQYQVPCLV